jgi:acyl-CoA synthetase (NDP forming)
VTDDTSRLERLLAPRALALVGATEKPGYAARLFANLVEGGYAGPVHPVSPTRDTVFGRPAFRSLRDVPGPVDVALVVVPSDAVPEVIEDCGAAGVAAAVVITAGFGEAGEEGRRRRELLRDAAARTGVLLIGPNVTGYASVPAAVWAATFSALRPREAKPALDAVLLSQSGGTAFGAVHERAQDHGFSFRAVLSTGNEEAVTSEQLAERFLALGTRVVAMVCEDFHDGPALLRAARAARERGGHIVVLKVGRSAAGRAAAATHTAALAADDAVVDGVLAQHGVIRVEDVDELVQCVRFLAGSPAPAGDSAIVLSHSGGLAAMAADALGAAGFGLPPLSDPVRAELDRLLPGRGGRSNPVDITMALREPVVADVVRALLRDRPDVLQVVTAGDAGLAERVAAGVRAAGRDASAVALVWTGGVRTGRDMAQLDAAEVPWFTGTRIAAGILGRCRRRPDAPVPALPPGGTVPGDADTVAVAVDEQAGKALLSGAGIPVPESALAATVDELVAAAAAVPRPWVLKVACAAVLHKAAAGLVTLGLRDEAELRAAAEVFAERAPAAAYGTPWAFLLERQSDVRAELYLGCTVDPHFGPVVGVGRGGADVEQDPAVVWSTCPLDGDGALRALGDPRLGGWLAARGVTEADRGAIADAVAALSRWFLEAPQRPQEVEINPLAVVRDGGVVALDAVLRLAGTGTGEPEAERAAPTAGPR